jgi:hypothetical protein
MSRRTCPQPDLARPRASQKSPAAAGAVVFEPIILRNPTKPDTISNMKPDTFSDLKPDSVPI